ncbi:MAG: 3'-5' exoribonuclease YhaM [Desulfovibrio sp.]
MPKTQFIVDFAVGDDVSSLFLIGAAQQGQARNGPFWKLALRDSSGSIEAKIWSPQSQMYPDLKAGDIAEIAGRISMYRERLEISVDRMRVLTEEDAAALDLSLFMAASERPAAELLAELTALCKKNFTYGPWKKLLKSVLNDPDMAARLPLAPAAKSMHHAYAGGLLEHTLGVASLCMALADLYPDLDRQTLLAGAVCHDLGKVWELSQGLATEYTEPGRLLGHMQLMLDFLDPLIRKSGLDEHLATQLKHLILSHHGQREYGSPQLPSTKEAFALHYADMLDAKLNQVRGALAHVPPGESGWSAYIPSLERAVFQATPTPGRTPGSAPGSAPGSGAKAGNGKKSASNAAPPQLSLLGGE